MKSLIISLKIFLFLTVLTGIVYPLLITGIAQLLFPLQANGSFIVKGNKTIGSELIGQNFDTVFYFSSRPSAISYNPLPSGGSNYGLINSKLKNSVDSLKKHFIAYNHLDSLAAIPSEMIFASASGLDPHISQKAALLQVDRIAKARNFTTDQKDKLIQSVKSRTEEPQFLILGEQRVNVLLLNLDIDNIK